jgi:amino-acid N-acetyltransferase
MGLGRLLVEQLTREARLAGFRSICAFTHEPGYFARLGFSLVPHAWLPEKIGVDCAGCALFRQCGQSAMRLRLDTSARIEAVA